MHHVALFAVPDLQILDLVGPMEVFDAANALLPRPAYGLQVVSLTGGPVLCSSGLCIETAASSGLTESLGTLVVAGGNGTRAARQDPDTVAEIARLAGLSARVTSVCSGAFLLAKAGLLAGRRATTHWSATERLAQAHPDVEVVPDALHVQDGPVWTSAGVTAGIDLALAMVAVDHGEELARQVAQWLVVYLRRPGGQSQFSAHLAAQVPTRPSMAKVMAHIAAHPQTDLSVAALARRATMSPRHFARVFAAEVGVTPAAHVERIRVEAARHQLETTDQPLAQIAERCGFGTVATLHRAMRRVAGVTPAAYRARFAVP
jgi:transcriptional regulator GlxA family with amidase domain